MRRTAPTWVRDLARAFWRGELPIDPRVPRRRPRPRREAPVAPVADAPPPVTDAAPAPPAAPSFVWRGRARPWAKAG